MWDWTPKLFAATLLAALLACSGGTGGLEGAVEAPGSSLSNQAGPVERPPVTVDSGPQDGCPRLCKDPSQFPSPEEIPAVCREVYEDPRDLCGLKLPRFEGFPEAEGTIPQREIPEVDCSNYLQVGEGYHPEGVPPLCKDAYESWWFRTQLRRPTLREPELLLPTLP